MTNLDIFALEFENNIVIFEISTLEFLNNEFLIHTVNFGIGSAFSQDPGPLYKVCRYLIFKSFEFN